MIIKTIIGFMVITIFIIGLMFIEFVLCKIKNLILKTSFGEWYLNNIKNSIDNIGIVLAGLLVFSEIIIASWQVGEWITG